VLIKNSSLRKEKIAGSQWLILIILATQEAGIRRIMVRSQPRQMVCKVLSQKHPTQKRAGGMVQVVERLSSKP
jgi:hypothetical protein